MAVEANSKSPDTDLEKRKNLKRMLKLTAGAAIVTQTNIFSYVAQELMKTSRPLIEKLDSRMKSTAAEMELDGDVVELRKMYLFATSAGIYGTRQIRVYTIKNNARKIGLPEEIVRRFNPENPPYKQFFSERNRIFTYAADQKESSMRLYDVDVERLVVYKEKILQSIETLEKKSSKI